MKENTVNSFKDLIPRLTMRERADAEGGAQTLRQEAAKHGVDFHDTKQWEAFMLGFGFCDMARMANQGDRAVAAVAMLIVEENLEATE